MGIQIETFQAVQPVTDPPKGLGWAQEPAVQGLLDVVASILAEEYVQAVKRHPEVFSDNGGAA
jgi:hypothetical protein